MFQYSELTLKYTVTYVMFGETGFNRPVIVLRRTGYIIRHTLLKKNFTLDFILTKYINYYSFWIYL